MNRCGFKRTGAKTVQFRLLFASEAAGKRRSRSAGRPYFSGEDSLASNKAGAFLP